MNFLSSEFQESDAERNLDKCPVSHFIFIFMQRYTQFLSLLFCTFRNLSHVLSILKVSHMFLEHFKVSHFRAKMATRLIRNSANLGQPNPFKKFTPSTSTEFRGVVSAFRTLKKELPMLTVFRTHFLSPNQYFRRVLRARLRRRTLTAMEAILGA